MPTATTPAPAPTATPTPEPPLDPLGAAIERFWETIPPIWSEVRGRIRTVAAEDFGITVEQFQILRHVRKGIRTASELAEAKQTSRPAVSQAVELLVDKGLLTRRQSVEDRRYVELELTPEGEAMIATIFTKNRGWMREQMASLTGAEVEQVLCGLEALQKAFQPKPTP